MRYSLRVRDWLKAFFMAIGAPVLTFIMDSINADEPTINVNKLITVGISAGIMYLLKNFFTDDLKVANKVISEKIESVKKDNEVVQAINTDKG